MKYKIIFLLSCFLTGGTLQAQYSRMHVKTATGSTVGITTGTSTNDKIIGISHDGTAGTISTASLGGGANYSPMRFLTASQVRMTILENGYIGIGTTSPTVALTVAGNIYAREVKVNVNAGAPDYVFAKEYRLLTLKEVGDYIRQNKHLPEVPPALEMEKEGINLSEMNMLLLKKIEELTLYAIDQNSKVDLLMEQLKAQQEEINRLIQSIGKN